MEDFVLWILKENVEPFHNGNEKYMKWMIDETGEEFTFEELYKYYKKIHKK